MAELLPTEKAQKKERRRRFRIIEDLVLWDNPSTKPFCNASAMRFGRAGNASARNRPITHERWNSSIFATIPAVHTTALRGSERKWPSDCWPHIAFIAAANPESRVGMRVQTRIQAPRSNDGIFHNLDCHGAHRGTQSQTHRRLSLT